jgi:hypothetical protein
VEVSVTEAQTASYWRATCPVATRAPLSSDAVTPVAVIGAGIAGKRITHRWSGQVLDPADGIAFVGGNPGSWSNVYIATGDSAWASRMARSRAFKLAI